MNVDVKILNQTIANKPHLIYLFTYQRIFWLFPSFGNYKWSCYKHLCESFCVDVSFQLIWVNTKLLDCWIIW